MTDAQPSPVEAAAAAVVAHTLATSITFNEYAKNLEDYTRAMSTWGIRTADIDTKETP